MAKECNAIIELSKARRALASATSFDDVLSIRDTAEAARVYARAAKLSLEAMNEATTVKLMAERKAGGMLAESGLSKGCNAPLRLADIDVSRMQSSRWQRLASIPESDFNRFIEEAKEAERELTTAGALKFAKQLAASGSQAAPTVWSGTTGHTSSLDELVATGEKFSTIYADPPWQYGNQATRASTDNHYATMSIDDLMDMGEQVKELAERDAHLWLWTTTSFLPDAIPLMAAWGFIYKTNMVWIKPQMGIGNYLRVSHEHLLLGVRGSLTTNANDQMSWIQAGRTEHSAKPAEFRRMVERLSPGPYLEMFGRQQIDGWKVFGNQVDPQLFAI